MIDGEALWTSSKLKRADEGVRIHYANWLPLAEANGVFEVDFDIIKARVYPIISPAITWEEVGHIYNEFVRVGLLYEWVSSDKYKKWAYFIGIDKPGRLPSEKHMKRYKSLPPDPPSRIIPDSSGSMPEGFGSVRSGMDGKGSDLAPLSLEQFADKVL